MESDTPLTAETIKFLRPAGKEEATVTFTSKDGTSSSVILPPAAQTLLLSMLLASAKGRVVEGFFELTRPPIRAVGFRHFVMSDDIAGIEVEIQNNGAIHLSFDGSAFQQLSRSVQALTSPSKNPPPQQKQH